MHGGSSRIPNSQDSQVCHIRFLTKMTLQSYLAPKDKKQVPRGWRAMVQIARAWVDFLR